MSLGFGRPHSSDSWSNRRSFDFSSRMHSVPRHTESQGRFTGLTNPYSAYDSDEGPWNSGACNAQSSMNGEFSHRCSSRPVDRVKSKQHDSKELKRKMVFVMHDEIRKPILTFPLQEISDIKVITEMCVTTMAAMLKSKTQRKFLYHRNNNAASNEEQLWDCDLTNNANPSGTRKMSHGVRPIKPPTPRPRSIKSKAMFREQLEKELNVDLHAYAQRSEYDRKTRDSEIGALRKLKEKLPPVKKRQKQVIYRKEDMRGSATSSLRSSIMDATEANLEAELLAQLVGEQSEPGVLDKYHKRKTIQMMTPQEALNCKWLRLSKAQVENFELRLREKGIDPGIHAHSKKGIEEVFNKDPDRDSIKYAKGVEEKNQKKVVRVAI